ncbi:MAG: hypothetical protein GY861_20650 [bacterium]|nr:hypothetical protein [bacterium]
MPKAQNKVMNPLDQEPLGSESQSITTAADLLISLLEEVKEISMADASKKLGVPLSTVEAWSTFLEEEKILSVTYKFTTPYLQFIRPKVKKEDPAAPNRPMPMKPMAKTLAVDEVQKEIDAIEAMLSEAENELKDGQFDRAKQTLPQLMKKIKEVRADVSQGIDGADPETKNMFDSKLRTIEDTLDRAHKFVIQGKYEMASKLYDYTHTQLKQLLMQVKRLYSLVLVKAESSALCGPRGPNEIDVLFEQAYKAMKTGDLDTVQMVYDKIRQAYYDLPKMFMQKKAELETDLIKLNKDLSSNLDNYAKAEMADGTRKINEFISSINGLIKKEQFDTAEQVYYEVKQIFETLPGGYVQEKKALQRKIIRTYEQLALRRKQIISGRMSGQKKMLDSLILDTKKLLEAKKINEAVKKYKEVKRVYEEMPSGFITEKTTMQDRILELYDQLSSIYKDIFVQEMQQKSNDLNRLLLIMQQQIKQGQTNAAENTYKEINEVYKSLPEGFLVEKTELQDRILKAYETMLGMSGDMFATDTNSKITQLNNVLDDGFEHVHKKRYETAEESYMKVVKGFNELPKGVFPEKTAVREKMFKLYRELMLEMDLPFLRKMDETTTEGYHHLLRLLVESHHNIHRGQFDLLEVDYKEIKRIFNDLPMGFVKEKVRLSKDVERLSKEVKLYKLTKSLEGLHKAGDLVGLKTALNDIEKDKSLVEKNSPEDKELIDFSNGIYSQYIGLVDKVQVKDDVPLPPWKREQKPEMHRIAPQPVILGEKKQTTHTKKDATEILRKINDLHAVARPAVKMPEPAT